MTTETIETSQAPHGAPPMTWTDAANASAEHEAHRVEWETSEEVIDVKLTVADMADMLRANGADEDAKSAVDREIDELKSDLKEKKAESETIAARMKDRNRAGSRESMPRKAAWKVGICFATNTAVYHDPVTGKLVHTRALRADERQVKLPLKDTTVDKQLSLGDEDDQDDSVTDPEALLQAAEASPSNRTLDNEPNGDDENELDEDELDEDDA